MNLPEGWPTKEMVNAASNTPHSGYASPFMYWKQVVINVLAASPTPPAQEDEPVAEVHLEQGEKVIDLTRIMELPVGTKLYTRPDDKLRRSAEEILSEVDRAIELLVTILGGGEEGEDWHMKEIEPLCHDLRTAHINLRAALEK